MTKTAIQPNRIPPGNYKAQLAVYDKLWLAAWSRKDRPAEPAIFSNVVEFTVNEK